MQFFKTLSIVSRSSARPLGNSDLSLRSKRFRVVSEQRNTEEGDFRFWPREKWNESQKVKEGEVEGKEGNFLTPSPLFYLRNVSRGLWLSFLVLFSKTVRKRLLRRLQRPPFSFSFLSKKKNNISNKKTSVYTGLCFQENIKTRLCASWKKLV